MTVKITKPEINIREKLNELHKPNSVAGDELIRAQTHADQMALLGNVQPKNMWINGDQRIWQRGTTRTGIGSSTETVISDRWRNYQAGTAGRCTWSQSTDAPTGYANSAKLEVTTADTSVDANHRWNVAYRMEPAEFEHLGFGKSTGLGFTIQFWVKSSVTGTYSIDVYKNGTNPTCKRNFTIDSPNTWEFKVMTWPHSTLGVGSDISTWIWLQAGSNYTTDRGETWTSSTDGRAHGQTANMYSTVGNTFYITGLQMAPGKHPSGLPFERRTYSEELALCQRYFERYYPAAQMQIYNESATSNHKWIKLNHAIKRSAPSLAGSSGIIGLGTNGLGTISSLTRQSGSIKEMSIRVGMSQSSGTANSLYHCDPAAGSAYFDLDCEL